MRISYLLTLAAVVSVPVALHATPITYTESFTASGTLKGSDFTNELVTFTAIGDTSAVINEGGIFAIVVPTTFTIAGGKSGTFTDEIEFVSNESSGIGGVGDISDDLAIIFTENSAFATYDLMTAIGPTLGASVFNAGDTFKTNDGKLSFETIGESTFSAAVASSIPEPSSLMMFGTGALGLLGVAKRKFAL
jgi:hypothetical protein